MDRPVSPTSIVEAPCEVIENISTTNWLDYSRIGFEYVQQKTGKPLITPGDCLLEFFNFDASDENSDATLVEPLFCLTICMLNHSRERLDEISPGTYDSLVNYSTNMYHTKTQTMTNN